MEPIGYSVTVANASRGRSRTRGEVEQLPSGSLRVRVYAGIDPVSKKRHYLVETVAAGPSAARDAERARTRLLNQVDERRNPRTKATVNQLLDRWLEVVELETTTRNSVVGRLNRHVRPVLGAVSVSRLDAETLESFYAQLRRCRERCGGHQAGHVCRPLAPATIRLIHANLSAALSSAVRWRWLAVNPAAQAAKPTVPKSDPQPPSGQEAARIVVEAWKDPDWGMLVWLAMVTGARRGELCALRWDRLDFTTGLLQIRTSIAQQGATTWEKDTKTHQQRRITLDPQTLALLRTYHDRRMELAAVVNMDLPSRRSNLLARAGRQRVGQARHRQPAVRAHVCASGVEYASSSAPALFGDRTDRRRSGCANRGRPARPWRRWEHNTEGVQRVAIRGRPARREFARHADADSTDRG